MFDQIAKNTIGAVAIFDLFCKSEKGERPVFLMRAPLSTISEFLALQPAATARIAVAAGPIDLHDERRYPGKVHFVVSADRQEA